MHTSIIFRINAKIVLKHTLKEQMEHTIYSVVLTSLKRLLIQNTDYLRDRGIKMCETQLEMPSLEPFLNAEYL